MNRRLSLPVRYHSAMHASEQAKADPHTDPPSCKCQYCNRGDVELLIARGSSEVIGE
jgi:hypothetical protein